MLSRLIARYEHGCSLYYYRRSLKAMHENEQELALLFTVTAAQELGHARYWWKIAGLDYFPDFNSMQDNPDYGAVSLGAEDSDGISRRYLWARFFFKNRYACNFDWPDILAFAIVGETAEAIGYSLLSLFNKKAISIAADELQHKAKIKELLIKRVGQDTTNKLLFYWYLRGLIAVLIMIPEMVFFGIRSIIYIFVGLIVGTIGLICWIITFKEDDRR